MKNDLLLYVGVGLFVGSMILGLAVAMAYVLRANLPEFKYGAFYTVFALVASMGYCLASIAFFFNFLGGPGLQLPLFCSAISLCFLAALIVLAIYVKKTSRVLFLVLSFYSLFSGWLIPVFLWNFIYIIFIARHPMKEPDKTLQTPTA